MHWRWKLKLRIQKTGENDDGDDDDDYVEDAFIDEGGSMSLYTYRPQV